MATSTPIKTQVVCFGDIPDTKGAAGSIEACHVESYQTPFARLWNLISDEGYAIFDSLSGVQFSKDAAGDLIVNGIGGWYEPHETRSFRFKTNHAGKFSLKMANQAGAIVLDVSGQMTDTSISY